MRKKFSPALIISWLLALSMVVYCAMLYVHVSTMQKIYGETIREDIFQVNDLSQELTKLLEAEEEALGQASLRLGGVLSALRDGTSLNADYHQLAQDLSSDLIAYGFLEDKNSAAAKLLLENIASKNNALFTVTQYIMEQLFHPNVDKMNSKYFDARVPSAPVNRRISSVIENLTP
ncbi:MAG TPA: hypothetical protein GX701_05295 [Clostridiales bacterium]|nr:hypothetical protein [Clostridiales bacterium]